MLFSQLDILYLELWGQTDLTDLFSLQRRKEKFTEEEREGLRGLKDLLKVTQLVIGRANPQRVSVLFLPPV